MKRNGKTLAQLGDGHPRRLSDARNAWRKMSPEQRAQFLQWATNMPKPQESYTIHVDSVCVQKGPIS